MEEQRIGRMYWKLFRRGLLGFWDNLFPRGLRRSSALPILVVIALIAIPGGAYYMHRQGKIHILKKEIKGEMQPAEPTGPQPGGMAPLVLTRSQSAGGNGPEFRSVTLLPGLGMSALQISAYLPGRGEVSLLAAPTPEEIADGTFSPKVGQNDTRGAFEAPWGGMLGGQLSPVGTLHATWRGHTLEMPVEILAHGAAVGGLLGLEPADSATPSGDHSQATAIFGGTDFDEHWLSKTDVTVTVEMAAHALILTVTAKNVGDQPEPMGIGWHPRFVVLSGNRDEAEVRLPDGQQLEVPDITKGIPSGRFVEPGTKLERFQGRAAALGAEGIDEDVVNLKPGPQDAGATAEFHDPSSQYGLKMTALSPSIRAIRVNSPSGSNYVSIGVQTNYDDPLGKEWGPGDTQAIQVLQPSQSMEWKVKLEIMPVAGRTKDR